MAQLKDLIVYGDTKFLGDVTLDHDPTAALHAATKAYVDSQVGTGTDEKLKVAALTSGTTYLPILAVSTDSGTAATRQIDKNAQALKYICTPGTSGGATKGTAQLILGNNLSEGYVNSAAGQLTIFGNAMYGVTLKYGAAYANQTLYLPGPTDGDQTNYLLSKIGSTAIGAADQPVYIDSMGHAVVANKYAWGVGGTNANRPGVYYPNNLIGTFGASTVTIGEIDSDGGHIIDGLTNSGTGSFMLAGWYTQTLTESHPAGSTTYTIGQAATWTDWTKFQYVQSQAPYSLVSPTSFTINNDGQGVLTFEESLNPTAAVTSIRYVNKNTGQHSFMIAYGTNEGHRSVLGGAGIYNSGAQSLIAGHYIQNSGQTSIVAGQSINNSGAVSAIFGYYNKNTALGAFMTGKWHDSTNGPANVAAVGSASLISADSAFVVGNGNSATDRANAFEVHTDGRATVGADPTANLDVATKQYVDNGPFISIIYNDVSEDGGITIHFNHFTSNPTTYNDLMYSTEFQVALKKVIPVYIGTVSPTMLLTQGILYGGLSGLLSTSWTILFPDSVNLSGVGLVNGITGQLVYANNKWTLINVQPHTSALKTYVDDNKAWALTSQGGAVYPAATKDVSTLPLGNVAVLGDGKHQLDIAQVPDGYTGNLIVWGNVNIVTQLASAGSTSYTINSATYTMPDGSLDELTELYYFVEDSVAPQKPTSVTLDGSGKPALTFASSLNPTADTTRIFIVNKSDKHGNLMVAYGATSTNNASAIVGNVHYNTGTNSLIVGQKDVNTGSVSSLLGVRLKNTKNGSFLAGSDNFNNSNMYSVLIGQGHYNTTGPVGTTAVGVYSTITSTTQFVVGNGTSASARSNAFEVTTTGEAKAVSFTENGTSLVNKYAAKTHTHNLGITTGTSSDTSQLTLAHGTKYVLSAGGSTYCFTMPSAESVSDTKVTQTAITGTSTTTFYPILLAYGTGQTATTTNTANFTANASITPSGDISANKVTSSTTFNYGANAYTQYNAVLKAIEFCFA